MNITMRVSRLATLTLLGSLSAAGISSVAGCQNGSKDPGPSRGDGAALALATMASDADSIASLVGGGLGTGGGYLIAAAPEKTGPNQRDRHREEAIGASERAERSPARIQDALGVTTADLNADGFVTLDEVVAMERAGLNDDEQVRRLAATHQSFEMSEPQERYLEERGIARVVIREMQAMNPGYHAQTASAAKTGSAQAEDRAAGATGDSEHRRARELSSEERGYDAEPNGASAK